MKKTTLRESMKDLTPVCSVSALECDDDEMIERHADEVDSFVSALSPSWYVVRYSNAPAVYVSYLGTVDVFDVLADLNDKNGVDVYTRDGYIYAEAFGDCGVSASVEMIPFTSFSVSDEDGEHLTTCEDIPEGLADLLSEGIDPKTVKADGKTCFLSLDAYGLYYNTYTDTIDGPADLLREWGGDPSDTYIPFFEKWLRDKVDDGDLVTLADYLREC